MITVNEVLRATVSYGRDIRTPHRLEDRTVESILQGIKKGEWEGLIRRVRNHSVGSAERKAAKEDLPFVTWSGRFEHKSVKGLLEHTRLIGIDVDNVSERTAQRTYTRFSEDQYCVAVWRSAGGNGLWLLFRIPRCTAEQHPQIYTQVAEHVRQFYRLKPDRSCKDVSRACFVSYDPSIRVNPWKKILPVEIPSESKNATTPQPASAKSPVEPSPDEILDEEEEKPIWILRQMGRDLAPVKPKSAACGARYTCARLLKLAGRLAVHALKREITSVSEREAIVKQAFQGWWEEALRKKVRGTRGEYFGELMGMFRRSVKSERAQQAARLWTRWREHPHFPTNGKAKEKIIFAIKKHCAERKNKQFNLSSYDAGAVAGVSNVAAWKALKRLRLERKITYSMNQKWRRGKRDAMTFLLAGNNAKPKG